MQQLEDDNVTWLVSSSSLLTMSLFTLLDSLLFLFLELGLRTLSSVTLSSASSCLPSQGFFLPCPPTQGCLVALLTAMPGGRRGSCDSLYDYLVTAYLA